MRIKFWVVSALVGCLALLLGLAPGGTQNPAAPPPADRDRPARPRPLPLSATGPRPVASAHWADERFRRLDRNGDGYLSFDEMTETLRAEKDRWDVNRDGVIDLDEWRTYVAAFNSQPRRLPATPVKRVREPFRDIRSVVPGREPRVQGTDLQGTGVQGTARPTFDETRLLRTRGQGTSKGSRAVKLPNNVPAWFKAYDTDGDGQVALHEWKTKEGTIGEFRKYDLNGDGFITVDELVRSGQFLTDANRVAPPTMHGSGAEFGDFFYYEVTGTTVGPVFGTGLYTIDSLIATTAVHAGVLRAGETAMIKATLLPGQQSYSGSESNGVTSQDFGVYYKSFRVEPVK